MRKRLRFLIPSLPQTLTPSPTTKIVTKVPSLPSWETETGSRTKPPKSMKEWSENSYATETYTSPYGWVGSAQEYWGGCGRACQATFKHKYNWVVPSDWKLASAIRRSRRRMSACLQCWGRSWSQSPECDHAAHTEKPRDHTKAGPAWPSWCPSTTRQPAWCVRDRLWIRLPGHL